MKQYDYLIVGAGLYGAVFAREMTDRGFRCLVIDKRPHVAGNAFTKEVEGINVHVYGAHIFHTSNKLVWDYVNRFAVFNRFTNSPVANYEGKLYNLPFNMNTFYQLWGVKTPIEAVERISMERKKYESIKDPANLEEQALKLVGEDVYNTLIKEYTEKQWGRPATEIPAFIIQRLPLRFNFDNNYFNDLYQGIPIGGYTRLVEKILDGIEVRLEIDYFSNKEYFNSTANNVLFTGKIDEYYNFQFGELEYRSLHFENEILDLANFQGNAVVNYTSKSVPYTRIIEHKHFEFGQQPKTVITREYPHEFSTTKEAFYPVNDSVNQAIFEKYRHLADEEKNIMFGGRLAEYKYYDMHHVIEKSLNLAKNL